MRAYINPLQTKHFIYGTLFLSFSLGIGVIGYHVICKLGWTDSFLNASMILTGMGPVDKMISPEAKIFASCYALYSGVAFLTSVGILLGPAIHVFFKKMRME